MTILFIVYVSLVITLFIFIAKKTEDHFSYFKLIFPDKLNNHSSLTDLQSKFSFEHMDIRFLTILPFFSGRRPDLEKENHQLTRLAKKIDFSLKISYLLISSIAIMTLVFLLTPNDPDYIVTQDKELIQNLQKEITGQLDSSKDSMFVDFNKLTESDWDCMVIFNPYCNPIKIGDFLNIKTNLLLKTNISSRDDICVIAFYKGTDLINYIEYPRFPGDFSNIPQTLIKRENAIFQIHRTEQKNSDGKDWINITLTNKSP